MKKIFIICIFSICLACSSDKNETFSRTSGVETPRLSAFDFNKQISEEAVWPELKSLPVKPTKIKHPKKEKIEVIYNNFNIEDKTTNKKVMDTIIELTDNVDFKLPCRTKSRKKLTIRCFYDIDHQKHCYNIYEELPGLDCK
jgi:hypothetical protein